MKKSQDQTKAPERRKGHGRRQDDSILPNFRDLIDGALHGILIHTNFRPLYVNESFARVMGYASPDDLMALRLIRPLFPEEAWAQAEAHYDDLVRGVAQPSCMRRMRALKPDGSEIWLSVSERVIDWYGVQAVQVNAFDITSHVKAEETMLSNEQRLRSMLEILPVPVYISRLRDGRLLFVNRKTCLLFQYSAGHLLKSESGTFFVDPLDHENLHRLLETVLDVREVEVRMHTAHGRELTAEIAAIVMDYGGEKAVLVALNDISQRKQLEEELFHQASTDPLTGISNRRYFLLQAEQDLRRAQRFDRKMTVMMIDLDHFKKVNDSLGHAVGDAVLEGVVRSCQDALRQSDVIGRLGGEEFGVLLPETGLEGAREVAERICRNVREKAVVTPKGIVAASVSIGVAVIAEGDTSVDDLFLRADKALYRAKDLGRNRVEYAEG